MNSSFPCKIGSKITVEEYNNFLQRKESSGYKYERKINGDVYVIDMSDPEHDAVVSLLQDYFNIANGGVIINKSIRVSGNGCKRTPLVYLVLNLYIIDSQIFYILHLVHFNPTVIGQCMASDVTVKPHKKHVQRPIIPYPGPPTGDKNVFFLVFICNI